MDMYQPHAHFVSPEDSAYLWRYMDISKLIDLLHRKSLYFTRADKLGDPWEGGTSYVNIEERPARYRALSSDHLILVESGAVSEFNKNNREYTFISCWHENATESAAMWKLYLKSDEGIAIRTTFSRLKKCLEMVPNKDIHIGKVNYFNPDKDAVSEGNTLRQFLFKLDSYRHEQEVRAVYQSYLFNYGDNKVVGTHIPVDVEKLIEGIYLAPNTPAWLVEVVQAVVKQFGLDNIVRLSSLSREPVF